MKGVIVQIGEPKSIVFFNNGKIRAIPTPADCRVGMVVTVKLNNMLKIILITLGAVLLLATGVFIGTTFQKERPPAAYLPPSSTAPSATSLPSAPPLAPPALPMPGDGHGSRMMERMRGRQVQTVTVQEARNLRDDTPVVLTGTIVESLGDEKYTFRDSSGEITVEIDKKLRRGLSAGLSGTVEISGEVDIERGRTVIDVKAIREI